jgi:fructose-1,6-bisphosphatase
MTKYLKELLALLIWLLTLRELIKSLNLLQVLRKVNSQHLVLWGLIYKRTPVSQPIK